MSNSSFSGHDVLQRLAKRPKAVVGLIVVAFALTGGAYVLSKTPDEYVCQVTIRSRAWALEFFQRSPDRLERFEPWAAPPPGVTVEAKFSGDRMTFVARGRSPERQDKWLEGVVEQFTANEAEAFFRLKNMPADESRPVVIDDDKPNSDPRAVAQCGIIPSPRHRPIAFVYLAGMLFVLFSVFIVLRMKPAA